MSRLSRVHFSSIPKYASNPSRNGISPTAHYNNRPSPVLIATLTLSAVSAMFIWQAAKGFSMWDEGFLWYGVQRVMAGEIPIRDFRSYDPGRYYWSAILMGLWGNSSIMALRGAVALFQAAGLYAALLLISRSCNKKNFLYLLLSVVTLLIWMYPRHKLFDISLSIFLLAALAFLVQNPTPRRYFIAGLCVGMAAVFGRNHGVYGLVGSLGIIAWLHMHQTTGPSTAKGILLWGTGIVAGFAPVLLMLLFAPDFAAAFMDNVLTVFERKTTNLPLPIPWPWQADSLRGVLTGLFFIAVLLFGPVATAWIIWQKYNNKKASPVLAAAAFLALPYAHFAFSRADVAHLAQGIFPFLIGSLVLLCSQPAKIKWPLAIILYGASLSVILVHHPGWRCFASKDWQPIEISGNRLQVSPGTAADVELVRTLVGRYAPGKKSFIVTPFWPGAYALFDRKAPLWDTYALFPMSSELQHREINRLKKANPTFAVVLDIPLDNRNELRYKNTHPLINHYIANNFTEIHISPRPAYHIFLARKPGQ